MINSRLKFVKNQAKAKQYPVAEPLLFENYSLSSSTLLSKIMDFLKIVQKTIAFVLMRLYDS